MILIVDILHATLSKSSKPQASTVFTSLSKQRLKKTGDPRSQ